MNIESMQALAILAESCWEEYLPSMKVRGWKSESEETQIAFRNALATVVGYTEDLRVPFDEAIWRGHDDGTVKRTVTSVRTRTVHKSKPGRPAPTPEELKAKVLAKKGIVLAVAPVTDEVIEETAE